MNSQSIGIVVLLAFHCSFTSILWKMSFSSHYWKIWPNPKIFWLLIEKKTSSKVPSVCELNLNSVKLVQPQTIQTRLKVTFLFVLCCSAPACCLEILRPLQSENEKRRRLLICWPCFRVALRSQIQCLKIILSEYFCGFCRHALLGLPSFQQSSSFSQLPHPLSVSVLVTHPTFS